VVVLCHGFGASGEDLVGIAEGLLEGSENAGGIELVFPAAPLALDEYGMPGGRAWWLLSISRLIAALDEGRYEEVREEVPPGIDEARQALTETVELLLARNNLDHRQLILGGFSQGAMLSMDVACRGLAAPPAGLCLYSGALICERQWKLTVSRLQHAKIIQSHGRQDPILPFQAGGWLRELLQKAGCQVDFVDFSGPHTIPWEAIERTQQLIVHLQDGE
jgi:phospholipase/carboxylesterase